MEQIVNTAHGHLEAQRSHQCIACLLRRIGRLSTQPSKIFTNFNTSLGMFVRMRTALTKVPCGSLDSVASTCDAPETMWRRLGAPQRTVWEVLLYPSK
ncbi:hypothetical protein EVAR_40573_1 [Eumeta japonica]|uniref:Uncharacterized protein n=1 Tax=Eumeta variegata TaxID=151549 RepID=A0A4C1VWH6_EUMVA|nr:hypothetical protein EVAR_40573_1 [Eumeta japonica]